MSLVRLLTAGKSLVGSKEMARYRESPRGSLPKFGSTKDPFRQTTRAQAQAQEAPNSKHQAPEKSQPPSSKPQAPEKSQASSLKLQAPEKLQASSTKTEEALPGAEGMPASVVNEAHQPARSETGASVALKSAGWLARCA